MSRFNTYKTYIEYKQNYNDKNIDELCKKNNEFKLFAKILSAFKTKGFCVLLDLVFLLPCLTAWHSSNNSLDIKVG